ncbi:MAG: hypothetical protein KCHDKBKB_02428 [Elusimicrobia bacterium]|nr:hypothetical protein [Elusimicrobiota bacterium]
MVYLASVIIVLVAAGFACYCLFHFFIGFICGRAENRRLEKIYLELFNCKDPARRQELYKFYGTTDECKEYIETGILAGRPLMEGELNEMRRVQGKI